MVATTPAMLPRTSDGRDRDPDPGPDHQLDPASDSDFGPFPVAGRWLSATMVPQCSPGNYMEFGAAAAVDERSKGAGDGRLLVVPARTAAR